MRKATIITALGVLIISGFFVARTETTFPNSLHFTRNGKGHWYSAENGGFEQFANGVVMDDLGCNHCHASTLADGTPVDAANYTPSCQDCHVTIGDTPDQSVCLGCHSRQKAEIGLSGNPNPDVAAMFSDVHRTAGMQCVECHSKDQLHGDGVEYNSMFETGHLKTTCEDCHAGQVDMTVAEHDKHYEDIECAACHAQTIVSCYNCHFETEVEKHAKRFYGGPPMFGWVFLVNHERPDGTTKVTTASFQSLVSADDESFYGMGPFGPHTITAEGRVCADCHNNASVQAYNDTGVIPTVKWDANDNLLKNTKGIIPVPEDFVTALEMDFVRFLGDPLDDINNPKDPSEWEFMKTGVDDAHMLYATPLTPAQMAKLSIAITDVESRGEVPDGFELEQNYPNPFNPLATVAFEIGAPTTASLSVYDTAGRLVTTLFTGRTLEVGRYEQVIDASALPSGTYIYRLEAQDFALSRTMTVVK